MESLTILNSVNGGKWSLKEYRKRNDSGAVYDAPRVAVGGRAY